MPEALASKCINKVQRWTVTALPVSEPVQRRQPAIFVHVRAAAGCGVRWLLLFASTLAALVSATKIVVYAVE